MWRRKGQEVAEEGRRGPFQGGDHREGERRRQVGGTQRVEEVKATGQGYQLKVGSRREERRAGRRLCVR